MLSVRRPRLHVRGDRSVLQERGMRSLLVTRLRRRSLRHRRVLWKTCLSCLGTNGASIMNDTYCWHDGLRSHALRAASSTSGQKMRRSLGAGIKSVVNDMLFSFQLRNMLLENFLDIVLADYSEWHSSKACKCPHCVLVCTHSDVYYSNILYYRINSISSHHLRTLPLATCEAQIWSHFSNIPKLLLRLLRTHRHRHDQIVPNLPVNRARQSQLIRRLQTINHTQHLGAVAASARGVCHAQPDLLVGVDDEDGADCEDHVFGAGCGFGEHVVLVGNVSWDYSIRRKVRLTSQATSRCWSAMMGNRTWVEEMSLMSSIQSSWEPTLSTDYSAGHRRQHDIVFRHKVEHNRGETF